MWTKEMVARLKDLCESKIALSFAEITKEINHEFGSQHTRNAVLGVAHRKKFLKTVRGSVRPKRKRVAPLAAPAPSAVPTEKRKSNESWTGRKILNAADLAPIGGAEATDLAREFFGERVPLLKTLDHHCRWPASDDGSAELVCGATAAQNSSYCPAHRRKGTQPTVRQERAREALGA